MLVRDINPTLEEVLITDDASSFARILQRDYSDYLEGELYDFLRSHLTRLAYGKARRDLDFYRRKAKEGKTILLRIFNDILRYYPDSVRIIEFLLDLLRGEYDVDYLLQLILILGGKNKVRLAVYLAENSKFSYETLVKYAYVETIEKIVNALRDAGNFDELRFYREFPENLGMLGYRLLDKLKLMNKITLSELGIISHDPLRNLRRFSSNINWLSSTPESYLWIIELCSEFFCENQAQCKSELELFLEVIKKYSEVTNGGYFEEAPWFWDFLNRITENADKFDFATLEEIDNLLVQIAEYIGGFSELNPEVNNYFPELAYYLENRYL